VDCKREIDCEPDEFCNALAQCEKLEATGGQGGVGQGGTPVGGAGQGGAIGGAGGGASVGGATATGGTLVLCTDDAQCDDGLACKAMIKGGVSRCVPSCSSDAGCPQGLRCVDDGTGSFCLGDDTGRDCNEPAACNFACITGVGAHCTMPCGSGSDCPNGYGCMPVGGTDVCVRTEALCSPEDNSACVYACDLAETLIVGGCTTSCNSAADCPQRAAPLAAWSCVSGSCARPADVYGSLPGGYTPVEYHCDTQSQPVALCNDALHIDFDLYVIPNPPVVDCTSNVTTAGVAGDACLNSCRLAGGCPFGYACVGTGDLGSTRIGLCLPTGSSEVGDACSLHRHCAFGYCRDGICSRDCTLDGICPGSASCVEGEAPTIEGTTWRSCQ